LLVGARKPPPHGGRASTEHGRKWVSETRTLQASERVKKEAGLLRLWAKATATRPTEDRSSERTLRAESSTGLSLSLSTSLIWGLGGLEREEISERRF
jgi:hypothetical protein